MLWFCVGQTLALNYIPRACDSSHGRDNAAIAAHLSRNNFNHFCVSKFIKIHLVLHSGSALCRNYEKLARGACGFEATACGNSEGADRKMCVPYDLRLMIDETDYSARAARSNQRGRATRLGS